MRKHAEKPSAMRDGSTGKSRLKFSSGGRTSLSSLVTPEQCREHERNVVCASSPLRHASRLTDDWEDWFGKFSRGESV